MTKIDKKIVEEARKLYLSILKKKKPTMKFPIRSLSNVKYDEKHGYFQLKGQNKIRTLSVNTVKTFAQTLRMMALSKETVADGKDATKREVYYMSKNWGDAKFDEQPESDTVMDCIIFLILHGLIL